MAEKVDIDCDSEMDNVSSGESIAEDEAVGKKISRHTPSQLATLNTYYRNGMVGVGKAYDALIASASADCNLNLTEKKVKVILEPVKLRVVVMVFLVF